LLYPRYALHTSRARSPALFFSHEISNTSVDGGNLFLPAFFPLLLSHFCGSGASYRLCIGRYLRILVMSAVRWSRIVCFLLPFRSVFVFVSPSHVIHSLCLPFLFVKSYFSSIFRNAFGTLE
jgi:hypothetical protein